MFTSLLTIGFFARFSYALARTPVLPLFALYLGAGPEGIGLVVGISTVTGIFFKLPAGALSDILGRKKTILIGLLVFALMPFLYLFISDYKMLAIVRFFHGFATAVYGPVSMAMVARWAGAKKGEMLSWFSSVTIIGTLIGAPVGGFILHGLAANGPALPDFQRVYILSGISGLIALFLALFLKSDTPSRSKKLSESYREFFSGIKEVLSDGRIVVTSGMEGLQNMSVGAFGTIFDIGHASGPILAGILIAGYGYFQSFAVMSAALLLSVPLFIKLMHK